MSTFVLIAGAWHGAWCWRRVARLLTRNGHEVFAPTLTGLCERSHLLTPAIGLDTHILDVVNEMRWQQLNDVVLVGRSYGGMSFPASPSRWNGLFPRSWCSTGSSLRPAKP